MNDPIHDCRSTTNEIIHSLHKHSRGFNRYVNAAYANQGEPRSTDDGAMAEVSLTFDVHGEDTVQQVFDDLKKLVDAASGQAAMAAPVGMQLSASRLEACWIACAYYDGVSVKATGPTLAAACEAACSKWLDRSRDRKVVQASEG